MSFHYEVVVSCFLEAHTPDSVLDTLFWLLGHTDERPGHLGEDTFLYQTFYPDPDSSLPGGGIAVLRQQRRGFNAYGDIVEWGLHVRALVHDDGMNEIHEFLELIEPHVSGDGYGGHIRAEHDATQIDIFHFASKAWYPG